MFIYYVMRCDVILNLYTEQNNIYIVPAVLLLYVQLNAYTLLHIYDMLLHIFLHEIYVMYIHNLRVFLNIQINKIYIYCNFNKIYIYI